MRRETQTALNYEFPMRPVRLLSALLLTTATVFATASVLQAQDMIVSHAYSKFGEPKYPADFPHLDYVNVNAPKGGEISVWAPGTFDSMNPYTRKGRSGALASVFFENMLTSTADEIGTSYCFMCTTMEYPEDESFVIFNMRPEVKFSDGSPVTAEDIKFSHDIMLEEGLVSFRAVLGQFIESVEVLDPMRIKFTFKDSAPKRGRIDMAGGLPVFSKAWFEENDAGLDESRLEPAIGSGPYVLDRFDINQRIVYKRNPDYWAQDLPLGIGRNNYDNIRIEYFGDSNAAFEGFKSGAYTFRTENSSKLWATGYDFPALNKGDIVKSTLPDGTIATGQSFVMNLRRDKFQDPLVREAIGMMFNFEWSNETLFYGLYARVESFWDNTELAAAGAPTDGEIALLKPLVDEGVLPESILTDEAILPPSSGARQLDRKNLRRASALMDEAGWLVGDDGMRRKDGQVLEIEFLEDSPTFDRIINPYVENLRRLGIDAKLERVDPAQFTNRTREFDFDMITDQFPMTYEPGSGLQQYFGSATADESVFNAMGLKSPAVDSLIQTITAADTKEDLNTGIRALDRVLRAEKFWVPQWFRDVHTVAYFDMYEYPDELPPYDLGYLDFWWINPEKEAALKASGAL